MKMNSSIFALAALGGLVCAAPAAARDGEGLKAHDVLVRVRGIFIQPTGQSDGILPALPNDRLRVDTSVVPEVDITWMATKNIGFELIAATAKHSAFGKQGVTQGIGRIVSTWVLPPTLTAQYHFNSAGKFRPYVGGGINYTIYWNEKASNELAGALGPTRVHLSNSVSWAAQAGFDIDISKKFFFNIDAKYVDMNSNATLRTTAIGTQTVRVRVNPVIIGAGFGIRL
ncbi:MAG: OmpW family outer membrane protein [Sphingomonas sp.]